MFDSDNWREIFAGMKKNKLRTVLTAISVAWGIFILIILLGAGKGLYNGARAQFMSDAVNSIFVSNGQTSMGYKGYKPGRKIQLTREDFENVTSKDKGIELRSAVYNTRGNLILSYKEKHAGFLVRPVMPDHGKLENATLIEGRYINDIDIREGRKVCAIGKPVKEELFGKESALNKFIDAEGISYKVVGVFTDPGNGDNNRIYIPLTTAQKAYNGKNNIDFFWISTTEAGAERSEEIAENIRKQIGAKYSIHPDDHSALRVENWGNEYKKIMSMLTGINIFIWIIGVFTLIAGIVGVSNIMMIIVKERTKEIGIRKAIGATPASIVMQIIMEAVFITGIAGYVGLLGGIGILEMLNSIGIDSEFFRKPEVNFSVAVSATVLIIVSGALAGFIPALRAAKVAPVVALRDE